MQVHNFAYFWIMGFGHNLHQLHTLAYLCNHESDFGAFHQLRGTFPSMVLNVHNYCPRFFSRSKSLFIACGECCLRCACVYGCIHEP